MKHVFLLLFSIGYLTSFAGIIPRKSIPTNSWRVISDSSDSNVEATKILVQGKVTDPYSGKGLERVIVATLDRKHHTLTDSTGAYTLLLNAGDTSIFAFKSQWEEVVIWKYNFQGGHKTVIDFYLTPDFGQIEMDKPVIYMYSQEEMEVEITLDIKGDLTFSYPEYKDGWSCQVNKASISVNGRNYPYLFWEGTSTNLGFSSNQTIFEGFIIKTDTTTSFLENILMKTGLNDRERTDFITYWAPRLSEHPYAKIQFLFNETYDEQIASSSITPNPESVFKIYMLFEGSDVEMLHKIKTQEIPRFERKGFTYVEWGGSELIRKETSCLEF